MISASGRIGLKAALFARRKRMGRAARGKPRKPTRWLYPWATERRYAKALRAWIKPMQDYVHQYLKNNSEAILHGDSDSLMRQDETPGGSYRRMVRSLYGWYTTYLPPITESGTRDAPPIVFMGLGNIANSMADFNSEQWNKAAKAELGVEFPVYESWWPQTKEVWQEDNYRLIQDVSRDYIKKVNLAAEKAIISGMSPGQLAKAILKIDNTIKASRVNLIARDQIGKLNGQVTQARMEAVGLEMYEWSTAADERVRDSHSVLEGMICRWDDPAVYSDDGGKTWKPRPSDWCQEHPGQEIQCRCTALSYWDELINEVDREIEDEEAYASEINIHDPGDVPGGELPEDPHLPSMKREFLSREGQKIESLDAETDYVRKMGIAAGNKKEFGTYIINDVIVEPVEGTKYSTPPSAETAHLILNSEDNTAKLVHYHTSGCSFSGEDLGTFSDVHAFSEIRVTTADGWTFSVSIKENSIRPIADDVEKEAARQKSIVKRYLSMRDGEAFDNKTDAEKDILVSRGVSQVLANAYNWSYKEKGPNGR